MRLGGVQEKASYLHAQFHRLRARRGVKKALCAVAASMLTAAYHMLRDGTFYQDLGADHFDRRSTDQQKKPPDRNAWPISATRCRSSRSPPKTSPGSVWHREQVSFLLIYEIADERLVVRALRRW